MRRSSIFLVVTAGQLLLLAAMLLHARGGQAAARAEREARQALAKELRLTDLCLFTEARYTRHPAMADLHAAFQDHPLALEHFPSGSLVSPPYFARERHGQSP
ncbi:MAG: hypothetical protein AB1634_09280 [Thermodesulfobacteriota bacterium]